MTAQKLQGQHDTADDGRGAEWRLFKGDGRARSISFPEAPPWRRFGGAEADDSHRERPYLIGDQEADVVNAALLLRRPLLVTGHPGTGKSSLAYAVAHELSLGRVLHWPVNSRTTLQDALYRYDAIGRLRETNMRREPHAGDDSAAEDPGIGSYVRLGPLGTALVASTTPRVLLVDELDKGDVDLPNDLLNVFEEGEFEIPELARLPEEHSSVRVLTADSDAWTDVVRGHVRCSEFPVVVITSNGERDFPPAFLRRCVRLDLPEPDEDRLRAIISAHLNSGGEPDTDGIDDLMRAFLARRARGELATDQLLNAVFLRRGGVQLDADGLLDAVLHRLARTL
ncbi:AAA family ATPase [Streptomyces sp. NBC_00162]|uniref:AAA family ATPase n=1 Tax=Streptomyces sp. NBC_00162 TaxID=2903629 RepID=UPI00214BB728|nr:AAA family ATPase [Streptomyces sp. NBC_00162]UUU43643.1 AAA family ATPase [Streptomyces sp. NBC_00162]